MKVQAVAPSNAEGIKPVSIAKNHQAQSVQEYKNFVQLCRRANMYTGALNVETLLMFLAKEAHEALEDLLISITKEAEE